MTRKQLVVVVAAGAAAGLGVAVGVALAGSSSTGARTVTVAATVPGPTRTITRVRTVQRVLTDARTAADPGPAAAVSGAATSNHAPSSRGSQRSQQFSGSGPRVLGTITVPQPGATLRWTTTGGRFRLLFNGTGVAVDSTARRGRTAAPPLTYQQVTVNTPGSWTIRIG